MAPVRTTPPDRAVSEFTGVAILVTMTVLVTASVGLFVLVAQETTDDGGPPEANFTFQYISDASTLLVTHDRGEEIAAGNLTIRGGGGGATWAELAGSESSEMVGPGATVQLSSQNAYGQSISRDARIRVLYIGENGTEARLETWNG